MRLDRFFLGAAAGFFAVALVFAPSALASVTVTGVAEWIRPTIAGPMGAVWEELERGDATGREEETLRIVAERLFPGLSIKGISISGGNLFMDVAFQDPPAGGWLVAIERPELIAELAGLFDDDLGDARRMLEDMISPVPAGSLSWTGQAFQRESWRILSERVPGWSPSFLFLQRNDGGLSVSVRFHALPPVVVAYTPRISSRTLPKILQSEITDDALEVLAPFIGLPGEWFILHETAIESMIAEALESKWATREMRGRVTVGIIPERIAPVDIRVESERYTLQAWAAVHMRSDERYPEIGIHLGRMTTPLKGWDLELYGEWVARTNDLSVESRWGARWSAWPDIWVGVELTYPGEDIWYRVWLEEVLPRVYLWGRVNSQGDAVAGIGWRFGGYLAWELYYDNRDEDRISVRLVGNL